MISPVPRHSVVIPAYNGARTIGATIESVLAQTERDLELVVVDDGSADDTAQIAARYAAGDSRVICLEQANRGTAAARNTGIAACRGQYVAFVDNDDLWMPTYLAEMGEALDRTPEAGFAYCDAWGFDDRTRRFMRRTELERRPGPPPGSSTQAVLERLIRSNFVMSSACVRSSVLERVGGFDPEIRGTDDIDMWLRILLTGHGAVRAGERPLLLQRGSATSQSADERMMARGLRTVLQRVAEREDAPPVVRAQASARVQEIDRELAAGGGGLSQALRRVLSPVLSRLRERRAPPPDVLRAFPDIGRPTRS